MLEIQFMNKLSDSQSQQNHVLPVVVRRDGVEPLLSRRVPDLQLDLLSPELDGLDLEVDADRRDERVVEGVVGEAEQYARLADAGVADEEQLEEQVVALFRHGGDCFCR